MDSNSFNKTLVQHFPTASVGFSYTTQNKFIKNICCNDGGAGTVCFKIKTAVKNVF